PALRILGGMSWEEIVKGLAALAGSMAVLGVGAALMAPVTPVLLAFGVAVLAVGAGLALAGAGILAVAAGISALAVAGPAGIKLLIDALLSIAEAIPQMATAFALGLVSL